MRGRQGGLKGEQRGADRDSIWRLSIDLCTKCNFIWGARGGGGRVSARRGGCPPAPTPWLRHWSQPRSQLISLPFFSDQRVYPGVYMLAARPQGGTHILGRRGCAALMPALMGRFFYKKSLNMGPVFYQKILN